MEKLVQWIIIIKKIFMQKNSKHYRLCVGYWHIPRAVYLLGGMFVFVSVLLALVIDERWLYFTLFVGFMLMSFALTGYCPIALLLDKIGLRRE
jgi:hypothetical protein